MKNRNKAILRGVAFLALQLVLAGCIGVVGERGRGRGPWVHDGPWMDGPRVGVGIDIHPPGFRR